MKLLHFLIYIHIIGLTPCIKPLLAVGIDVRWEVSPWSECQLNKTCTQPGLKLRTVHCIQNENQVKRTVCEQALDKKPLSIESCVPEQCALERKEQIKIVRTDWSQCQVDQASEFYFKMQHINKTCQNKNEILVLYVKTRETTCQYEYKDKSIQIVDALICARILNLTSTIESEVCYEKCVRPCALTTWSKWKACKHCRNRKTKYKSRDYAFMPDDGEYAPGLCSPQFRLKQKQQMNVNFEYQYKVSEWKHVSILYQKKKARSKFSIYKRNVTCIDRKGNICDHSTKNISSIQIQVGDVDCSHGLWTSWSNCAPKRKGSRRLKQYRIREILLYPSGNGKMCGDVRQERKCRNNARKNEEDDYKWDNGNWSPCFLNNAYKIPANNNCSVYVSRRDIFCIKKSINQPVSNVFCSRMSKPNNKRLCKVLCHHECLYTDWTKWSPCLNKIKERHKEIINKSPLTVCRRITHRVACSHNNSSVDKKFDYFWHQTTWSECAIPSTNKNSTKHDCLIGTQMRKNVCVKKDVFNVVNDSFCKDYLPDAIQVRKCFICPKKCSLTVWSEWYPECAASCNPFNNNQRSFTQRRRFILSHGNKYGEECPDSKELYQTKECPKCLGYYWVTEKWDVCTHSALQMVYQPTIKGLQNGYQIRNVYCSDGSKPVADSLCADLKPIEFRECHINWLVTCNIKPWSDWSECTEVCGGGEQHRTRSFTSEDCKNDDHLQLNETRMCNTQACNYYKAQKGPWSSCHPIGELSRCSNLFSGGLKVNLGVKYRNVTCYDEQDRVVPNKYCEEYDEEVLSTKRRCILPCVNDCRMSEWSRFTPCSATCGTGVSLRTRKIYIHASKENKKQCPPNDGRFVTESIPCKVIDCFDLKWKKEKWSKCKVDSPNMCGQGMQNRTITCLQLSNGKKSNNCDQRLKPRTERKCFVPCANDCLVSDWSDWSTCDGSTNRTREIKRNGSNCPALFQTKECQNKVTASWKVSVWSSCFTEHGTEGDGIRTRLVECVDSKTQTTVHPKHCITSQAPQTYEICQSHTRNSCEMSEWTTWSSCGKQCGVTTYKSRTRKTNGYCGNDVNVKETLICPMLPCFKLTLGEWSKCRPLYKNSCGEGTRDRHATCTRDDGNVVNLLHCENPLTGKSLVKESCMMPCWNDCVLSEWSQWSMCFGGCHQQRATGNQIRSRFVLQEGKNGGKPCPNTLEEKRTCDQPECFTFSWVTKNEQYKCKRSDGLIVSTGCKLLPSMYECDCTVSHATCIQKQYCMCEQGHVPQLDHNGVLRKCAFAKPIPSKINEEKKEKQSVSVLGIVFIIVAACVGYCILFAVIMFLYKRRNKKQLLRSISEGAVGFHSTLHKNQYNVCHDRTRNLIRLSNRHSNSCSSGISSTGMTEQTHLSSLQMGVDTIAIDSDHYDEADDDGMLTML